ncbi:MAG TPA: glycosyltransferase family 4 protein [Bacteroidota bacterium]|nr:glycosyltransferase family 4 protein [Bacteroidota bacterium]
MSISTLHFCTSDSWGGLELYACTLIAELKNAGCSVLVVCKPHSKVEEFLKEHAIPFVYLPSYLQVSIRSIWYLRKLFRQYNIQIIHAHFHKDIWPAALAVRYDRTKKLFFSVYMGIGSKDDFWHRYIFGRVNGFITSSKTWRNHLPKVFAVPDETVYYLPYGRYLERYSIDQQKRRAIRSSFGFTDLDTVIGTMVRIDPGKGVVDFVESFLCLDQKKQAAVKFLIVGEPTRKRRTTPGESPFEPQCEEYFRRLQSYVVDHHLETTIYFTGFQHDTIGYLGAMDIFVFPSRNELFSLVMLDAMSLSLPIVASREGGNLEQVQDGVNGLLYETANPQDLAENLSQYLNNVPLRNQMGQAGRAFVEAHHDMKKTIHRLIELYEHSI